MIVIQAHLFIFHIQPCAEVSPESLTPADQDSWPGFEGCAHHLPRPDDRRGELQRSLL